MTPPICKKWTPNSTHRGACPRRWGARAGRWAALGLVAAVAACSSGLGTEVPGGLPPAPVAASSNLKTGIDFGFDFEVASDGAPLDYALAGGVIRGLQDIEALDGYEEGLPIVFVAFSTDANATDPDPDSTGDTLDPELGLGADSNGARDIVIAAVPGLDLAETRDPASFALGIDSRAFVQSMAPSMRHPRCTTCHSMKLTESELDTDMDGNPDFGFPGHPGGNGPTIDNNGCTDCHVTIGDEWRAPPLAGSPFSIEEVNLFQRSDEELFVIAQRLEAGIEEHFHGDDRVSWALGSSFEATPGQVRLPTNVVGFNGVADDDRDGIVEKEDTDGIARPVPGGRTAFLARLDGWLATEADYGALLLDNSAKGLADVLVASRSMGMALATGNGDSFSPEMTFVPTPNFDPQGADNVAGLLKVAFVSTATDLTPDRDLGSAPDVFVATIEVRINEDSLGNVLPGAVNLAFSGTSLISKSANGNVAAQGASGFSPVADWSPVIAGAEGQFVAFGSGANDLVDQFVDRNGSGGDVFVHSSTTNETILASRAAGMNPATSADGGSFSPALSPGGRGLVFASAATDLVGGAEVDDNGFEDVFLVEVTPASSTLDVSGLRRMSVMTGGAQATGGHSRAPSVFVFDESATPIETRVAFESDKTDLVASLPLMSTTNAYLRDERRDVTVVLNQAVSSMGTILGAATQPQDNTPAPADSQAPILSTDGSSVVFESLASNIDLSRPGDSNYAWDVFITDLSRFEDEGYLLPLRASVTQSGGDANGSSRSAALGAFAGETPFPAGLGMFVTEANNLGASGPLPVVSLFLSEEGGIAARFDPSVEKLPVGAEVLFTDMSTGMPDAWTWDFGVLGSNTDTSTEQSPVFVYQEAGTYSVSLTVSGPLGTDTASRLLTVVDELGLLAIEADVIENPGNVDASIPGELNGVPPFTVLFGESSTEGQCVTDWNWEVTNLATSDVVSSDEPEVEMEFDSIGSYLVTLVPSNPAGDGEQATFRVSVFDPATSAFTSNGISGDLDAVRGVGTPLSVDFESLRSPISGATFEWNFGSAATPASSTEPDPQNVLFPVGGPYNVSLTVTGQGFDVSQSTAEIQVFEQVTAVATLVSPATGVGDSGVTPFSFTSADSSGDIAMAGGRLWFLGDPDAGGVQLASAAVLSNQLLQLPNPGGATPQQVEIFLRVQGETGGSTDSNTSTDSVSLTLFRTVDTAITTSPNPLQNLDLNSPATFDASVAVGGTTGDIGMNGGVPQIEWFDDLDWMPGALPALGTRLSGLDGRLSITQSYGMAAAGAHQVVAVITSAGGTADAEGVRFVVGQTAEITASELSGPAPLDVTFGVIAPMPQSNWSWNFDDVGSGANTSTSPAPSHRFDSPGTYTVAVMLNSTVGGVTTPLMDTLDIVVHEPVSAGFEARVVATGQLVGAGGVVSEESVAFTSTSSGAAAFAWEFTDPSGSMQAGSGTTITRALSGEGTHTIKLTATGPGGSDVETLQVLVTEPDADFSFGAGTAGLRRTFTDTSDGTPVAIDWIFNFTGDVNDPGNEFLDPMNTTAGSPGGAIVHDFAAEGMPMVAMRATYSTGFQSYKVASVTVNVTVKFADILPSLQFNCGGCHTTMTSTSEDGLAFSAGAHSNIVGVSVNWGGSSACNAEIMNHTQRVARFRPDQSLIMGIADGSLPCASSAMDTFLGNTAQIQALQNWILQGAVDN